MKLPSRYFALAGERSLLGIKIDEIGRPRTWPAASTYPPLGFLPISPFQLGNGDMFGFYWPVGREDSDPIVCEMQHDAWRLDPCAADVEGLLRFLATYGRIDAEGPDRELFEELANALHMEAPLVAEITLAGVPVPSDENSPSECLSMARSASGRGDLDKARQLLFRAVGLHPEFGEVWVALAQLCRRQGDLPGSAQALMNALSSPMCFGGDRERALRDAQRIPDDRVGEFRNDPLWVRRNHLSFKTGLKHSDDYGVLDEAIAAYFASGAGASAVRLRILYGERMARETTAFQERYGFTRTRYFGTLRDELARAGLTARLRALQS